MIPLTADTVEAATDAADASGVFPGVLAGRLAVDAAVPRGLMFFLRSNRSPQQRLSRLIRDAYDHLRDAYNRLQDAYDALQESTWRESRWRVFVVTLIGTLIASAVAGVIVGFVISLLWR